MLVCAQCHREVEMTYDNLCLSCYDKQREDVAEACDYAEQSQEWGN